MLSILQAAVLGAVQGLTEFIPISSSGHLVIVPALFDWPRQQGVAFEVLLHTASLLALLIYFSGDILDLVRGVMQRDRDSIRLSLLLIIGSIPAGLAGLLLRDFFEAQYDDAAGAALQLLLTAAILVAAEQALRYHERRNAKRGTPLRTINDMNPVDATAVGIGQAVAIVPGIAGFVLSLVTSYAAIAGLIRYLRSRTLYPFAAYCAAAGVAFYLILR